MIQLHTYPININTRIARASTGLSRMSSMRAVLNSKYCMRAQLKACNLVNEQINEQSDSEYFSYQEGQHRVVSNGPPKGNGNGKLHLPEEIKITKTRHGKRWITSSMEVELAKDVLEVRDGLGRAIDAVILKPMQF